ncbi:Transcription initiation factor TFIID subunit 10 [Hordeum vulgare]|nr:Transcription initiation factor TFIID subunit 10 [Hordeum vulgare]
MMGSNNPGGAGGGMAPGMGAGGSDGRHDDEAVLTEFLSSLMDYNPMIPDELVEHYLGRSGFHCPDLRLTRLVAVATQKFISDVASDSLQHCKARVAAPIKDNKSKQPKDRRLVLTMDDLSKALREGYFWFNDGGGNVTIGDADQYTVLFSSCQDGVEVTMDVHTKMYKARHG